DGRFLVWHGVGGGLSLWDVETGRELRRFKTVSSLGAAACFGPDGKHVLAAHGERGLGLWETDTGRCVRELSGHTGRVEPAGLSADGRHAFTGGEDKTLRLWDVASGRCLRTFHEPSRVERLALRPDGKRVLSAGTFPDVHEWQVDVAARPPLAPPALAELVPS